MHLNNDSDDFPTPCLSALTLNTDWTNRDESVNSPDKLLPVLENQVTTYTPSLLCFNELSSKTVVNCLQNNCENFCFEYCSKYPGICVGYDTTKFEVMDNNWYLGKNYTGVLLKSLETDYSVNVVGVHMPNKKSVKASYELVRNYIEEKQDQVNSTVIMGDFNQTPDKVKEYLDVHKWRQTISSNNATTKAGNCIDNIYYTDDCNLQLKKIRKNLPFTHFRPRGIAFPEL